MNYMVKNIDDELWKLFKLGCVKRGMSMKEALLRRIKEIAREYEEGVKP